MKLYTDGGCKNGIGGWAWALVDDGKCIGSDQGSEEDTTNNRMELLAVINGLKFTKENTVESFEMINY